jgi:hypothetical protein
LGGLEVGDDGGGDLWQGELAIYETRRNHSRMGFYISRREIRSKPTIHTIFFWCMQWMHGTDPVWRHACLCYNFQFQNVGTWKFPCTGHLSGICCVIRLRSQDSRGLCAHQTQEGCAQPLLIIGFTSHRRGSSSLAANEVELRKKTN